jgi:hypothetical protein
MVVSFMYCTLQPACLVFYLVCHPVWGVWSSGKSPQKLLCSCCGDLAMVRSWVSEQCEPNALLCNSLEIIVNNVRFQICTLMCTVMYTHYIWSCVCQRKKSELCAWFLCCLPCIHWDLMHGNHRKTHGRMQSCCAVPNEIWFLFSWSELRLKRSTVTVFGGSTTLAQFAVWGCPYWKCIGVWPVKKMATWWWCQGEHMENDSYWPFDGLWSL